MGPSTLPTSLQDRLRKSQGYSRLKYFSLNLNLLRNIIFALFLLRLLRRSFYTVRGYGIVGTILLGYSQLRRRAYTLLLRSTPGIRARVDKDVNKAIGEIEAELAPQGPGLNRYLTLPKEPWTADRLDAELATLVDMKRTRWEDGKVSGAVYHGGVDLLKIQSKAMELFSVANPIHPDVFPGVRKMEAEIVAMVLSLFNAPPSGAGTNTSGGTESILLAVLSARNKAASERSVTEPELIIPSTAHAAFHKAASYFKIKLHVVPCPAPSYRVSIAKVRRLINPNTIMLVGSAPNYPHGIVDDIPALSRLATGHGNSLPLHVDCCLGSFLLPFLASAGFPTPFSESGGFDFTLPAVTSISVDTHKYGFAPKGNSVILYRTKHLRQHQYFICPDWSGGVYGSPSMAGSRPGALIAGCWASLMSVGEAGYMDACHRIVGTRITIQNAINEHPVLSSCLRVIGEPTVSVVAFQSCPPRHHHAGSEPEVNIYDVADAMSAKGWHLNSLQDPPGIHVAVTLPLTRTEAVDALIRDLVDAVQSEREKGRAAAADAAAAAAGAGAGSQKGGVVKEPGRQSALYGVAVKVPDKTVVERLVVGFLDTLYKA